MLDIRNFVCVNPARFGNVFVCAGAPIVCDNGSIYVQALVDNGIIKEIKLDPPDHWTQEADRASVVPNQHTGLIQHFSDQHEFLG